jgi:hypothetical protein
MHGNFRRKLIPQIGGIAGMVKISVGDYDQPEIAGMATHTFKHFLEPVALI